jgi:Tetracyclin repressor-like, C-terminal domain
METQTENRAQIRQSYVEYMLENGKMPPSAYLLAKKLGMTDTDFYAEYNSLDAVEADIWLQLFEEARQQTTMQEVYERYSVREKLLSFYYTWIEVLKANRSFVLFAARQPRQRLQVTAAPFRRAFIDYAGELINEGRNTGEVVNRVLVTDRYADGFWYQAMFVLRFWIKDISPNFEQTDAAIEKAVNTSFDLIGKSPLDSLFDFGKFLFQNR